MPTAGQLAREAYLAYPDPHEQKHLSVIARSTLRQATQNEHCTPASEVTVTLRLITEHDLLMLHDWLNRPHTVEWWGVEAERPTFEEVRKHYLPRVMAKESLRESRLCAEGCHHHA